MWSDVEYVYRCLADEPRTEAYRAAIEAAVKPGDVVLDLGSGSGIMGLFAARAGARHVYAIEAGKYLAGALQETIESSGYASKMSLVKKNATKLTLSDVEPADVIICEMITTGLIGEMQGPVLTALRSAGIMRPNTRVVPGRLRTSVTAVSADFEFFGMPLKFPVFVDHFSKRFERRCEELSERQEVHVADFTAPLDKRVHAKVKLSITKPGMINGLLLTSDTDFDGAPGIGGTVSYCQPVILPVDPPVPAKEGKSVTATINYSIGDGFDGLRHRVRASR
jgi:predicted RNA methylase